MPVVQQICYNGEYYSQDTPIISHTNRAFRYGDSLFETIHANGTRLQFFKDHFCRLQKGMNILKMTSNDNFNEKKLELEIVRLLNKNKLLKGARIRLSVFRQDGGLYSPNNNQINYLIEASPLDVDNYDLNPKGYRIGLFTEITKPINYLSNLKTGNSLIYILASIFKTENNFSDVLITNNQGEVCEATSSNLFIVRNNEIQTPALNRGCVEGIMRKQIIRIAQKNNIIVNENIIITKQDLLNADELFITNAINGIKWIVAFEEQRYFNKMARFLMNELNREEFGD